MYSDSQVHQSQIRGAEKKPKSQAYTGVISTTR